MHFAQTETKLLHFYFPLLHKIVLLFVYGVLWGTISILIYRFLKNLKNLVSTPAIPGPKISHFNLYGICTYTPSYSTRKKIAVPLTAYFQQVCSGLAVLFPGEKAVATRIGFQTLIFLKKAESVEEFLCRNTLITKPFRDVLLPFFGSGLFLSAGMKWKARRKRLTPVFRYDIIKGFVPVFDEEAKVLVDNLRRKQHEPWIDVVQTLGLCAMDIICKTFLGLNVGAQKERDSKFVNAMARVTRTIIERIVNPVYCFEVFFAVSTLGRQFKQDICYLREYATQTIRQRKEERKHKKEGSTEGKIIKGDVMELLLHFEETDPDVNDEDIRDELMSFIFAGGDTTASAMVWALYLIGLHPEIQTKIHEELDAIIGVDHDRALTAEDLNQMRYLDCVLKESQRLYPSVPFNGKYVLEDCTLSDFQIKKNSIVVVDTYNLHRNPDVFPNPEVFDPDRFLPENCIGRSPYAYVPFSGGVRSCIGRRYAVMESMIVVANVLHKFSVKSLEPRDKIHASMEITLQPLHPLKVKFEPRHVTDATQNSERM